MTEKQKQIIKTAREMFSEYGYKKVTMDELAKKSGVTKKTIYTYFKDKDDLIKYFVFEKVDEIKEIVRKIEKKDLSISQKTHEIIYAILNYQKDEKFIKKLSLEALNMPLGVAKKWADFLNNTVILEIKKFLDDAVINGYIKSYNTELLANIFYRVYVSIIFENKLKVEDDDINEMVDILNYGLFRGENDE
ncbi:MAG: TetR/AcrR family transcriptional regulator [Bacilli bacterium]|nr:TetR/AcrR family transcriptional regulator [Bacilli bacterium]